MQAPLPPEAAPNVGTPARDLRITIVQGAFLPVPPLLGGAVEKVWTALGQEFARRGHHVTHLSRSFGDLPAEQTAHGVQHRRVRGYDTPRRLVVLKGLDLLYSLRVRRVLPPSDIIVTNTFWLPMLLRSPARGHLYVHVQRFPKGQMRFYTHAARVQTVSRHIEQAILREAPALRGRTQVIPNPLWAPVGRGELRPRDPLILYVGRIHPEKGLHVMLRALAALPAERLAAVKIAIVGPADIAAGGGGADYLAELQAIARPLGERIEWVGPVYDAAALTAWFQRATLFVYPSLAGEGEASPLAPVEAMAQGCAPLVSDLECFRDYLEPEKNGFVFDHRGPHAASMLAQSFSRLLADPARLAAVGRAARESARRFSIEQVADQYLADFASLATPAMVPR